jgi:TonB family protein
MVFARAAAAVAGLFAFSAAAAGPEPEVSVPGVNLPAGIVLAKEERVTAAFATAADGRTTRCRIVAKSPVAALNDATCDILMRRARFAPGSDQRILFHWWGPPEAGAADAAAERGDPLLVIRSGWITNNDYPVAAYSNGVEGEVVYAVDVSPTGRAAGCRVTRSSGSDLLDGVTCQLLVQRAVFIPAVDAQGRPRAGVSHGKLSWRMHG